MKKNKGFSLVELLVVLGIIGVLSSLITPKFMGYLAKSKEVKAIATLESLRTASEFYYLENGKSFMRKDSCGPITQEQFEKLKPFLSNNSKALVQGDKVIVEIGGSKNETNGPATYGGTIGFTTLNPSGDKKHSNGIDIWFDADEDIGKFNLNNKEWKEL